MNGGELPEVGSRAELRHVIERFPHFRVEAGARGTVTEATAWLVALRLDERVVGAEHWDNELCWTADDAPPESAGSEQAAAAAFHRDAQIVGSPTASDPTRNGGSHDDRQP